MTMTLNFEADQPVVGLKRQQALINAILGASSADETRWLEWKSRLDVARAEGAFSVSKAILGFANRMPDVAAQWADGHAYLVVGVEEGALHGVETHDVEKVDAWLGRYLGTFDRYQFTYVPFDNGDEARNVMIVDVFPPRWGDPVHPLCKEHQNFYPGTVFHRYSGKTMPARPTEIDALSERARRAAKRVTVDVSLAAGAVALVPPTQDMRVKILEFLREEQMEQLGTGKPTGKDRAASAFGAYAQVSDVYRMMKPADRRSPEDFREEVDQYLRDYDAAMQQSLVHAIHDAGKPLTLRLTNPSEDNLTKVEVVLSLPDTVWAHATDEDDKVGWPHPPRKYGTAAPSIRMLTGMPPIRALLPPLPSPAIEQEEGCTIVRFLPVNLRPHETVTLTPITVYSAQEAPEVVFSGQWRATATNVSGKVQRSLPIPAERLALDMKQVFVPWAYEGGDPE
ncbi:hypothetical protein GCM10010331_68670 [Streptomyces xanthochromogenes]|uniref:AlbA family DNA-binding domain-containing protein n=1 Tax=Streptomyces xanthochromogenes TaxID=67384 RepID=UPI0016728AC6|nr:hypothetical protein [Streptomyces xanthochromogenes]GHB71110.1 hypothetical protein GCM10010331_68670 [Streptomyces xanthochromogenes]